MEDDRIIRARFSSRCKRCAKWLAPGDRIRYTPGRAVHLTDAHCATAYASVHVPRLDPTAHHAELLEVGRLLAAAPWTYAATMPATPHHWTTRRQWQNDAAFDLVVLAIKQFGQRRRWKKSYNDYLTPPGAEFYYWVMDERACPPQAITLINRAEVT